MYFQLSLVLSVVFGIIRYLWKAYIYDISEDKSSISISTTDMCITYVNMKKMNFWESGLSSYVKSALQKWENSRIPKMSDIVCIDRAYDSKYRYMVE